MQMVLRKPRTARLMGLSDIELAEALGINLKRLVDALNEAGLRPLGAHNEGAARVDPLR